MSILRRRAMMQSRAGVSPVLPAEYQQVEWIETDGHCLINTNVVPIVSPLFEAEYFISNVTQDGLLVCFSSNGEPDWTVNYYTQGRRVLGRYGSTVLRDIAQYSLDTWHTISASQEVYYDGALTYTWSAYNFSSNTKTICLFARLSGNAGLIGKVKTCTIKDGNTVKFIGIPCYRKSNGEIGMYDIISETFFTNIGTGTFTKGADVN